MIKIIFLFLVFAVSFAELSGGDLHLAGDSTMQNYSASRSPQQGWGQRLGDFTADGVKVYNNAVGGCSTRRFRRSGYWKKLITRVKPGDHVILQFGHNDGCWVNTPRHVPLDEYAENLTLFIHEIRQKKAIPILVTPIPYCIFERGKLVSEPFLAPYVAKMIEVAEKKGCDLIDLNRHASAELEKIGEKKARQYYMFLTAGQFPNFPNGRRDNCHIRDLGARFYAEAFVEIAKKKGLAVSEFFK